VVRVLGYKSGGPGSIPRHYQKKSSGFGTGSTQPREYNWGATWYKRSGSCVENWEYGRRDPSRWPRGTLYPQKLAIISPTSDGRLVSIVRSRTQTMELLLYHTYIIFVISTILLQSPSLICYTCHCLELCVCLFPSVITAHFAIGLWTVDLTKIKLKYHSHCNIIYNLQFMAS
jgi:hypothetical protein